MTKNPHAQAMGKLGGAAKSNAKTLAARANIRKRWNMSKKTAITQAEPIKPIQSLKQPEKLKLKYGETDLRTF